jgi:hypothetical protein
MSNISYIQIIIFCDNYALYAMTLEGIIRKYH